MTINYTTLLGIAKPVTGTETGVWGDIVNNQITSLFEDAIANTASVDVSGSGVSLTDTDGSSNQARCAIVIATGTPGTSRNIVAPSQSKSYIVINQSDSSIVFKGGATTGVTIATGKAALVAWNGSDFETIATNDLSSAGDVDGPNSSTDNTLARFDGTTGKLIQGSGIVVSDANAMSGLSSLGVSGPLTVTGTTTLATSLTGLIKAASGVISAATANTDYLTPPSGTAILKANSGGALANAIAGTDYLAPAAIGVTVQAYNANTAFRNTAQTFTASQRGTVTTDNDGSFSMTATNNFKCTPTGNFTLTFTNITAGQSGNIWLDNSGGYTISAASAVYINPTTLAALSSAGIYWLSYYSPDGTNVAVTASGALT